MVKLRVWLEACSLPKLKLACPLPSDEEVGLVSRVALTCEAAARSILPAPLTIGFSNGLPLVKLLTGRWAELTRADFTCSGDQPGWSCSSRAADPATWGVAMLVPWKKAKQG